MAHHELSMPIDEARVRALRVNDTVTLQRTLYGIRDATLIHMFDRGRTTRFDLRGHFSHEMPHRNRRQSLQILQLLQFLQQKRAAIDCSWGDLRFTIRRIPLACTRVCVR